MLIGKVNIQQVLVYQDPRSIYRDFFNGHYRGASINHVDKAGGRGVHQMSTLLNKPRYIMNLSSEHQFLGALFILGSKQH